LHIGTDTFFFLATADSGCNRRPQKKKNISSPHWLTLLFWRADPNQQLARTNGQRPTVIGFLLFIRLGASNLSGRWCGRISTRRDNFIATARQTPLLCEKESLPTEGPDSIIAQQITSVPRSFVATEQKSPIDRSFPSSLFSSLICYRSPTLLLQQANSSSIFEQNIFIFRSASICALYSRSCHVLFVGVKQP
jgi:hypothetical protein